jgi:hypothetical protein
MVLSFFCFVMIVVIAYIVPILPFFIGSACNPGA